jgi:hypothetical protein
MARKLMRRVVLQGAVVLAAIAAAAAPVDPALVERWFSTSLYLHVQRVMTPVSNTVPIAWLDVATLSAAGWLLHLWWTALRRGAEPRRRRAARAGMATLTAAAVVYLAFLAIWGFNYRRADIARKLVVDGRAPTTADVLRLGETAAARLNGLYAFAHNAGWETPPWRSAPLRAAFAEAQDLLADAPNAAPGRLKRTMFGPFFRWTSVDGMINPFGLEVLANPDLLPFERPFVAAHEWAHLAGYAHESEANFVGWLTCLRADETAQYSGWLYLYWQVAGELPQAERQRLASSLAEGPRGDLAAIAARLRQGDLPALRRASWMVYDSYLKANRVDAGIRSYGQVVTLILRAKFDDGWTPVRRSAPSP